jgi:tRNA modification GTPase
MNSATATTDTIFALSSGRPRSAIAVVRISGSGAGQALARLGVARPEPRRALHTTLRDGGDRPLDDALVFWFPGPQSATGEDVVELHVHGSHAVLAALFRELAAIDGFRAAEPGEFTRRSFENGKLDLTEVEGLADLIDAETEMQRRQALRQLKGWLGHRVERWRRDIIAAAALVEAGIDFSDEGDVPAELMAQALPAIARLRDEIDETLRASTHSERLRDGLVVAIAGPPNAGKSTLLNRLAHRDAAIVSPHAGTTRDAIEVHLDVNGYPLTLIDTAGVRETNDPVEQEGVKRALARAAEADLVLWLVDAREAAGRAPAGIGPTQWTVHSKVDLIEERRTVSSAAEGGFWVSAAEGQGIDALTAALGAFAARCFGEGESAVIGRTRHRGLLQQASEALARALNATELGEEIVAEELRSAVHSLGRVTGRVNVEDILAKIFAEFCIGK